MSLIEEIKSINQEAHQKWFERWYQKIDLENTIKRSASKGYTGYRIDISEQHDNYLRRRLVSDKTTVLLKNKLGEGFEVTLEEEHLTNLLKQTRYRSYILIRW